MGFTIEESDEEMIALFIGEDDPERFDEAINQDKWKKAMEVETNSIEVNDTWELLTQRSQGHWI